MHVEPRKAGTLLDRECVYRTVTCGGRKNNRPDPLLVARTIDAVLARLHRRDNPRFRRSFRRRVASSSPTRLVPRTFKLYLSRRRVDALPVTNERGFQNVGSLTLTTINAQAPRGTGNDKGRNTATPYGVTHRKGQSVQDIANAPSGERTLKVSSTTPPKKLAGSIVMVCKGGEAPMLLPLGAACINQAVKGIAIAKRELLEGAENMGEPTYLSCFPDFRDDTRRTLSMQCDKEEKPPWTSSDVALTVAAGTKPAATAGAIAGKVREGLKVAVRACGADAVSNAVYAVAYARKYLKDNGVDVYFCPEFDKEPVGSDGQERTVVLFKICKAAGSAPVAETRGMA